MTPFPDPPVHPSNSSRPLPPPRSSQPRVSWGCFDALPRPTFAPQQALTPPPPAQILAAAGELAGAGGTAISTAAIDGQWSVVAASSEAPGGGSALVVDSEKGLVQVRGFSSWIIPQLPIG